MKRVGLVVAYDGTKYSGWQTQPNGITIQGVLNDTLSELLGVKDRDHRCQPYRCRSARSWKCGGV